MDSGRVEEAAEFFRKAEERSRGVSLYALMGLARASVKMGRPGEALSWMGKVPEYLRDSTSYWEIRGEAFEMRGEDADAARSYEKALELSGYDHPLAHNLGSILMRLGDYQEAERVFKAIIMEGPDPAAFNSLGVSLALQGKAIAAKEMFRKAVELNPASEIYRANYRRASQEVR